MSIVVAFSGPQGSGKSTLLSKLKETGFFVDDYRVSRAVQTQLGWEKLDHVMQDVATMQFFQEKIFEEKYKRDSFLKKRNELFVLTERSFADIAAYTSYWCWEHVHRNNWSLRAAIDWLQPYYLQCVAAQHELYRVTVLLPFMQHVKWENDPKRAPQNSVDIIQEYIETFLNTPQAPAKFIPYYTITEKTPENRALEVEALLERFVVHC